MYYLLIFFLIDLSGGEGPSNLYKRIEDIEKTMNFLNRHKLFLKKSSGLSVDLILGSLWYHKKSFMWSLNKKRIMKLGLSFQTLRLGVSYIQSIFFDPPVSPSRFFLTPVLNDYLENM